MINRLSRLSSVNEFSRCICFALAMLLAGCGAFQTPVMQKATALPEIEAADEQATEAQPTPLPTATLPPPTPTAEPTETPTPLPTATPEPTAAPILSPIDRLVAVRDADNGAALFVTFQETAGTGYSCSNCHLVDSEKANLGPGLLNIKDRALTRVEGKSAAEYIYESIIDPMAYLVEDFDAELMPKNWSEIYTDLEIFDIVAYLLTLEGESDIDDPDPVDANEEETAEQD